MSVEDIQRVSVRKLTLAYGASPLRETDGILDGFTSKLFAVTVSCVLYTSSHGQGSPKRSCNCMLADYDQASTVLASQEGFD